MVLEREFQLLQRLPLLQRAGVLSRLAQVVNDPRVSRIGGARPREWTLDSANTRARIYDKKVSSRWGASRGW
jgi:hypothetical protein